MLRFGLRVATCGLSLAVMAVATGSASAQKHEGAAPAQAPANQAAPPASKARAATSPRPGRTSAAGRARSATAAGRARSATATARGKVFAPAIGRAALCGSAPHGSASAPDRQL